MTQRTCNIIMACKSRKSGEECEFIDKVNQYMSKECDCPIEHYTQDIMDDIMFETMCDYIDTCDSPSAFLRNLRQLNRWFDDKCVAERIAIVFESVQVRHKDNNGEFKYINGFTADLLAKWSNFKEVI